MNAVGGASAAVTLLLSGLVGCGSAEPRIAVTPDSGLVDAPVGIRVDGLPANDSVWVRASFEDDLGQTWGSEALLPTDERGVVDLATTAPLRGSYQHAEPAGLLWSMRVRNANPAPLPATAEPTLSLRPLHIALSAEVGGRVMAHTAIVRQFLGPGVRRVDLRDGSLVGTLFVPAGPGSHPAALVVTGSSGGLAWANQVAALLASRGRAALALAYFDWQGRDGLPAALSEIPLEYFTAGIDRLLSEPGVDANDLAAVGMSKGGELVLLLATADPRISRVVAYVPSSVVWQATRAAPSVVAQSSWSRGGKPLAFVPAEPDAEFFRTFDRRRLRPIYDAALADSARARQAAIPVERIAGPVLLISGSGDEVWPSGPMSEQVLSRRKAFGAHSDDRHLSFAGMGHVFGVPFLPAFASDDDLALAAHAEREAWEAVLVFLTEAGRGR